MAATPIHEDFIAQAWVALAPENVEERPAQPAALEVTGSPGHLLSAFAVEDIAVACVGVALLAAAALHDQRGGGPLRVSLDRGHVARAIRSERYFLHGGVPAGAGFAPLSRFWRTSDGWVRTHANYPWHRSALLRVLGTTDDPGAVASALAKLSAEDVEERVFDAGGIAAGVRSLEAWQVHRQGRAVAAEPLISHRLAGQADARRREPAALPAAGVRVLDLTRVIAGPVCTRFLAALGAEVLRVDPFHRPDMAAGAVADALMGKRSSRLDLADTAGVSTIAGLLDDADVVVCGYRPGALDRFGLDEQSLAERHPGLVVAYIDAWGHTGPWANRRGFDSVVQAATGIAAGEAPSDEEPGCLPCQLLDHGTGYLLAAAVLDGLRRQGAGGGTHARRLSLARTAAWVSSAGSLRSPPPPLAMADPHPSAWMVELEGPAGRIAAVAPPGMLGNRPLLWPFPPRGYGVDPPTW